jgi:hypothetical protein
MTRTVFLIIGVFTLIVWDIISGIAVALHVGGNPALYILFSLGLTLVVTLALQRGGQREGGRARDVCPNCGSPAGMRTGGGPWTCLDCGETYPD